MHSYRPGAQRKAAAIRHMSGAVDDLGNYTAALMPWMNGTAYDTGEGVSCGGKFWRCTTPHTSNEETGWVPGMAAALWQEIGDPTEEWPEWLPHITYNVGDKVTWEGKYYTCKMNNITHSPGEYPAGWEENA